MLIKDNSPNLKKEWTKKQYFWVCPGIPGLAEPVELRWRSHDSLQPSLPCHAMLLGKSFFAKFLQYFLLFAFPEFFQKFFNLGFCRSFYLSYRDNFWQKEWKYIRTFCQGFLVVCKTWFDTIQDKSVRKTSTFPAGHANTLYSTNKYNITLRLFYSIFFAISVSFESFCSGYPGMLFKFVKRKIQELIWELGKYQIIRKYQMWQLVKQMSQDD